MTDNIFTRAAEINDIVHDVGPELVAQARGVFHLAELIEDMFTEYAHDTGIMPDNPFYADLLSRALRSIQWESIAAYAWESAGHEAKGFNLSLYGVPSAEDEKHAALIGGDYWGDTGHDALKKFITEYGGKLDKWGDEVQFSTVAGHEVSYRLTWIFED